MEVIVVEKAIFEQWEVPEHWRYFCFLSAGNNPTIFIKKGLYLTLFELFDVNIRKSRKTAKHEQITHQFTGFALKSTAQQLLNFFF